MLNRKSCTCCLLISQVMLYVSEDTKKLMPSTVVGQTLVCSSLVFQQVKPLSLPAEDFDNYKHVPVYIKSVGRKVRRCSL